MNKKIPNLKKSDKNSKILEQDAERLEQELKLVRNQLEKNKIEYKPRTW